MPMTFTTEDYLSLSRLLSENPELRADVRRLVLTEDLLDLPAVVRDLGAAQQRTEKRVEELAAAQQRTEKRVEELTAAQQRTEEAIARLTAAQERTDAHLLKVDEHLLRIDEHFEKVDEHLLRIDQHLERVDQHLLRLDTRVGSLEGRSLERDYRDKATSIFGLFLRRVRPVDLSDLGTSGGALTRAEFGDLARADVVVTGKLKGVAEAPQVDLVAEVSVVVDRGDVERAVRRAGFLKRATGRPAIPVVAGETLTDGADAAARRQHVVVLQDGRQDHWEDAAREWAGVVMQPE